MTETEKFVIDRLDIINTKIDALSDKIDKRVTPIEQFQYKIMGIALFLSTVIPIVISFIKT